MQRASYAHLNPNLFDVLQNIESVHDDWWLWSKRVKISSNKYKMPNTGHENTNSVTTAADYFLISLKSAFCSSGRQHLLVVNRVDWTPNTRRLSGS